MADGRRTSNFTGRELPAVAPRYRRVSGRMLTAAIAGAGAVILAAMHVARHGTVDDRIIAGSLCILALLGVVAVPVARQRPLRKPRRVLLGWVSAVDPPLADRLGRALALADAPPPGTSVPLANLHAERALAALPLEAIDARLATTARRWGRATGLLAFAVVAFFCAMPVRSLEGALVLFARHGEAPLAIPYVSDVSVTVEAPEHLREPSRTVDADGPISVAAGSRLSVRAHGLLTGGRALFLRRETLAVGAGIARDGDGGPTPEGQDSAEVAFVEDGQGGLVAHLVLTKSATYRVAARLGDVFVRDPQELTFEVVPDAAPVVRLEGAPKRYPLHEFPEAGGSASPADATKPAESRSLPLRWEATDDHGLREIDLVLRSGDREERRVLAKPDARPVKERGGTMLRDDDPFFERAFAPIEVTIEARDDDPQAGKPWGKSPAFVIVPPAIGAREAARMAALRAVRDAWVDALAAELELPATDDAGRTAARTKGREALAAVLKPAPNALSIPTRLSALLEAAWSKAEKASKTERKVALERAVSTVDGAVQGTAQKDAREAAEKLALVADDLFRVIAHPEHSAAGATSGAGAAPAGGDTQREADRTMLLEGGEQLHHFGSLGHDLGEIVTAYLKRFDDAHAKGDDTHAALAAKDLAVRLHEPDPSFGARGRSGRSGGGGESGGGDPQAGAGEGGEPSPAEKAFQEAARQVDSVAKDHADQLGKTNKTLQDGASADDQKATAEAGKKKAEQLREALKRLPPVGSGSDSWTQKGAEARDQGEQVARNLEEGNVGDAEKRADSALQMLEEAKQKARRERMYGGNDAEKRIQEAATALEEAKRWSADQKKEQAQKAAARARSSGELGKRADEEGKLADRMKNARKSGEGKALPDQANDALAQAEAAARRAQKALEKGDPSEAEAAQKEAQAALEAAQKALGNEGKSPKSPGDRDGDGSIAGHADIPGKDAHKGPEDCRRRVLEGLAGGRSDAVKRYAEGLLR
jgi:hypothetical protein